MRNRHQEFFAKDFLINSLVLFITMQRYYFNTARELMRINGTTRSSVVSHFAESIAGAMTIKAFGEEDRFFLMNLKYIDRNSNFERMNG